MATILLAMTLLIPGNFANSASVAEFRSTPVRVMATGWVAGGGVVAAGTPAEDAAAAAPRASGLLFRALASVTIAAETSEVPWAPAAMAGTLAGMVGRNPVICGVPDFAAAVMSGCCAKGPHARPNK